MSLRSPFEAIPHVATLPIQLPVKVVWKKKDQELASAEVEARKKRIGLWGDKSPVAPWEWRKGNRNQNSKLKPKKLVPPKEAINTTVYITNSGKKYHAPGCRYLKTTGKRVSLFEA